MELLLADPDGRELAEVVATTRKLSFVRNGMFSATVSLDEDAAFYGKTLDLVASGVPRLKAWRDVGGSRALVFNGALAPFKEDAEVALTGEAVFKGALGELEERFTGPSRQFTQQDAGDGIARVLIEEANAEAPTGIRIGTIEPTKLRDRTYQSKQLSEAVVQLSEVIDGFDFELAPVDEGATFAAFNVYVHQGQDRTADVVFEYGADTLGNVASIERQTLRPVNKVRVLGMGGVYGEASDPASIALHGLRMQTTSEPDISEQATLNAKAEALIRPEWIRVVSFKPDPAAAPKPWDDYWLGDTVTVRARRGPLYVDLAARVNAIEVELDANGVESYTLTIEHGAGAGVFYRPPDYADQFHELARRVRALEHTTT